VRILNRRDCCGGRLAGTKVFVDEQLCGQVQGGTRNGQWYTVKCSKPLFGQKIRIVTTQRTYLSISGFEAWTGAWSSSSSSSTTTTTTTSIIGRRRATNVFFKLGKNLGKYKSGWCSHPGSTTSWADIDGDGKDDMICDDTKGNHWA
jgi:hypothetical protein